MAFDILTRDQIEASITGNPFVEKSRLILRIDMAAQSDELKAKLQAAPDWDLVICDEAHRLAASYFGGEVKEAQRRALATPSLSWADGSTAGGGLSLARLPYAGRP